MNFSINDSNYELFSFNNHFRNYVIKVFQLKGENEEINGKLFSQ